MIFYISAVAIAIWIIFAITKIRHKLLVVILIAIILFGYFSINSAFEGKQIDLGDFNGVAEASGIYFSWLSSAFGNAGTITSRAVENSSSDDELK